MAKASFQLPEDFLLKLSQLGDNTDHILGFVLQAGANVVQEKVKANLESVIGKNNKTESHSTGELVSSLGVTRPLQDREGNFNVKVGFSEPRSDGNSNAKIASVLEYGKHNQPAKPFMKPAKSASQTPCIEAMKEALAREVEKL